MNSFSAWCSADTPSSRGRSICLARAGLGGSEDEEEEVEEDVEEVELEDLLGPVLVTEVAPALPPGC